MLVTKAIIHYLIMARMLCAILQMERLCCKSVKAATVLCHVVVLHKRVVKRVMIHIFVIMRYDTKYRGDMLPWAMIYNYYQDCYNDIDPCCIYNIVCYNDP